MEKYQLEEKIVEMLKTVYDPEIPVNLFDLGLIYRIDVLEDNVVEIDMTLTAPNCPAADFMMEDVKQKVSSIEGVKELKLNLVFEPEWSQDLMTEEAKLELGLL
ncbi:MAG: DUF59 domain-containing protein [Bacteroidaceae bacterium]|nr:DUF59 domain-containing protein [Bacteroidaceae bacterium]